MKNLRIIPVPDSRLIPRYLLEQVKGRAWTPDEWYQYRLAADQNKTDLVLSIIDKEHVIVGFIWLCIDALDKHIFINTLSVDPVYQLKSRLINFVAEYIKKLAEKIQIPKVVCSANRTRALKRYGFSTSEYQLLEIDSRNYGTEKRKTSEHSDGRPAASSSKPKPASRERTSSGSGGNSKPARSRKSKRLVSGSGCRTSTGTVSKRDNSGNPGSIGEPGI